MEIKIFTLSTLYGDDENSEMNKFLRSHKVINIEKEFYNGTAGAYWTFCISYIAGKNIESRNVINKAKKDYKKVLGKDTFVIFEKLRKYRKEIAKNDAVPAFAVFTDAELIQIAKLEKLDSQGLKNIDGVGEKKLEKYGIMIIKMYEDEKNGKST